MIDQRDGKLIAEYDGMVTAHRPHSPVLLHCAKAFLVGGLICTLGQGLIALWKYLGVSEELAPTAASVTLVFLSALATGLNVYDKLAKHAGAGPVVANTGVCQAGGCAGRGV